MPAEIVSSSLKRKASDMEMTSDETTRKDDTSWIPQEMDSGATGNWQGDVDKSDTDNAAFIAGWDSELTELSCSEGDDTDESDSEVHRVSPDNYTYPSP